MAKFDTKSIRNIALLGHGGSGKTSLAESMLYIAGATDRLGKVEDGNTVCDYDAEEIKRGFTLSASLANIEWKGIKINILDTPGYLDFAGEVNQALRVAGSAVITVDAKAGVEVGTELAWDSATAYGVPKVFFVNKCDDGEASFDRVFKELDYKFGRTVCPVFVPVGDGKDITMLDLIALKAYKYDYRGKRTEVPVLDVNYHIDFATEGWFQADDGFYYYKKPLQPDEHISIIVSAMQLNEKEGYELRLQLLTNTIQAYPADVVSQAWPAVQVDENGELEPAETPNGGVR